MFEKIAGYEDVKKELLRIRDWCLNKDYTNNENVTLPKGIVFYGKPGNGKTLFLKEYSESFGAPIIVIEGNKYNKRDEIKKAFAEARKNDFSIIVIDEIDSFISDSDDVERILQAEMDGIKSVNNVLVLATTNNLYRLGKALLRKGRFDRKIEIKLPDLESRKLILDLYCNKLGLSGDIDLLYLARMTESCNCADIMAILNDAYLRCGQNINTSDIEDSYDRVDGDELNPRSNFDKTKANIEIAYHEIAHALLLYKNRDTFTFHRASFNSDYNGGMARFYPTSKREEQKSTYYFKQVEISIAGYVMTKLKFKRLDMGCQTDLQEGMEYASTLVNLLGYSGPQNVLPLYSSHERMETESKKRNNEIKAEKIIKKAGSIVKKYLKANMRQADALVNKMMTKGYVDIKDLEEVMSKKYLLNNRFMKKTTHAKQFSEM